MFTDIQGSTRLLSRLGTDPYAVLLADHHRIVRGALSAHEGTERDTQGDAFFATFDAPSAAIGAAIEIQRALARHAWPATASVLVRMGIHAGEAAETPTGLVGEDVHRAARIAGVAHGGQVVLSEAAAAMVRDSLSGGTVLRDLGLHRLKDLGRPHLLFQLVAEGLQSNFLPLRSLDNPELPNNLPSRLSTFVGRVVELDTVCALVESHRLVTVAGSGGSGKTRLALEVAARLVEANREGVFFVDLAKVGSPEEVPAAIQSALGLPEVPSGLGLEALLGALEVQNTLIVLDNCEHVVDECARVADLIEARSKAVRLLVTSREPLGVDGEHVYRLSPLSLPPSDASSVADLADSDAIALFVERVRAQDASFVPDDAVAALLASVCRRLDGVPFALELAAARLGSMSLADLHRRLDQRFGLLTSGSRTALPRQRTLQATVDWSYDLLSRDEQSVLDRLSVFVGSFDLAAAEAVCGTDERGQTTADALASLVDKSLVVSERNAADLRFRLLETIRQYSADKLAGAGDAVVAEARQRHAAHYLALAERASPALSGGPEQARWMRRIDLEWPNLRIAAELFGAVSDHSSVLRLATALDRWLGCRCNHEVLALLLESLRPEHGVAPALRARGCLTASFLLASSAPTDSELLRAIELTDAGIEIARGAGDKRVLAELLVIRAMQSPAIPGDPGRVQRQEHALAAARETGEPELIGLALMSGAATEAPGSNAAAQYREALGYLQDAGDAVGLVAVTSSLSHAYLLTEDLPGAYEYAREAVRLSEQIGANLDAHSNLAVCALLCGDLDEAARAARISLVRSHRGGAARSFVGFSLWVLACVATQQGDLERAARLTAAHDALDARLAESAAQSFSWTPPEQRARDDNHRQLRALLGDEAHKRAWTDGGAMSLDSAIDLALGRSGTL